DYSLNDLTVDVFFFFFQAEDGIRDKLVTGVQTCALPISTPSSQNRSCGAPPQMVLATPRRQFFVLPGWATGRRLHPPATRRRSRSEERRVGKECRSRWSPEH